MQPKKILNINGHSEHNFYYCFIKQLYHSFMRAHSIAVKFVLYYILLLLWWSWWKIKTMTALRNDCHASLSHVAILQSSAAFSCSSKHLYKIVHFCSVLRRQSIQLAQSLLMCRHRRPVLSTWHWGARHCACASTRVLCSISGAAILAAWRSRPTPDWSYPVQVLSRAHAYLDQFIWTPLGNQE